MVALLSRLSYSIATVSLCGILILPEAAFGQPSAISSPASFDLPTSLKFSLEALGASSGVPDGIGGSWYPGVSVRDQPAGFVMSNYQAGATIPISKSDTELVFANASICTVSSRTTAILPASQTRFPSQLWDLQVGSGYVRNLGNGWNWGLWMNAGSASDKPFHTIAEATISGLAFVRVPRTDETAWLFYVVSTTNGQVGRNIPIPGIAYEFQYYLLKGALGFPFVTLNYRPQNWLELDFNYAALTDILARVTLHPTERARVFASFVWTNESWLRADRQVKQDQLFRYEKRLEVGFGWSAASKLDLRLLAGYAFNRYFVENAGYSLTGVNRIDLASGPFLSAQLEWRY